MPHADDGPDYGKPVRHTSMQLSILLLGRQSR